MTNAPKTMIGQLLDRRYRIVQILGSGAFGQTYLAADTRRPGHPQCVVKQLRPPKNNPTVLATALRLFEKEAEVLEKLGQHDRIPRLLAYFKEGNYFYLVEEFIEGRPLSKELVSGTPWTEDRTITLLEDILDILLFVHEKGVIHRDINPSNLIRRSSDQKLVLIDFGSVKQVTQQLSHQNGHAVRTIATGTPTYMPIEQFQGNPQFNSDIYATGMIAVQALTGMKAADLPKLQDPSLAKPGETTWHDRAKVSEGLTQIIDRMIHHHYGQRYQSVMDVIAGLRQLTGQSDFGYIPPTQPIRTAPRPKSWSALTKDSQGSGRPALKWLGIVLLGGLVLMGVAQLMGRPSAERATAALEKGMAELDAGQPQQAIKQLDRAIKLDSGNARAFQQRGNAYYDSGNLEQAIADYSQAIQLNPSYVDAYLNRGLAYQELNNLPKAIQDFSEVIELQPQDADAYYQRGLAYLMQEDYPAAIRDYDQVIRLQPEAAEAYRARGTAQIQAGKLPQGMADYTEAIRLDSDNAAAYYDRGRARFHLGDYEGALSDYNQVIELEPENGDAYGNRCSAQINIFEHEAAIEDCTKAIELKPNAVAYNNRCVAYLGLSEPDQAVADCTKAIELVSNNGKAYGNRGSAYVALEEYDKAIADYTKAIDISPSDAEAYSNRASAYTELEEYDQAIADYAQAIRLKPDHAGAYYGRGQVRVTLGDDEGARKDFQRAGDLYLEQGLTGGYKDAEYQLQQLKN